MLYLGTYQSVSDIPLRDVDLSRPKLYSLIVSATVQHHMGLSHYLMPALLVLLQVEAERRQGHL